MPDTGGDRTHAEAPSAEPATPLAPPRAAAAAGPLAAVLSLQHSAGNRAVTRALLARQSVPAATARADAAAAAAGAALGAAMGAPMDMTVRGLGQAGQAAAPQAPAPAQQPAAPSGPTPPLPTTGATVPAAGAPTSATRDIDQREIPANSQRGSAETGGNTDPWFDDVVRNHLGVTVPANSTDPYDWLLSTLVRVNVFGQTSGPVLPRFATKLQRASIRAEEMIRERLTAAGTTVTGSLTPEQWNIRSVSGWDSNRQSGSHAFGQATDIDYNSNPYVAHEAGEPAIDRQTGPAYDRAVILFGDGQRFLSVVPNGDVGTGADRIERHDRITAAGPRGTRRDGSMYTNTMQVFNQLASDSMAMEHYFALVYPAPDLRSMTPTPATPHNIDVAAVRTLLPRIQALPVAARNLLFDGHVPATIDEASVAGTLRPIIERDYLTLGGTATNAGRNDAPFATRGGADQRAQRDPRRGFMTLPFEVVYAMRAEGLRWGACDLGGASGDIQHFDDALAHPIPRRTT